MMDPNQLFSVPFEHATEHEFARAGYPWQFGVTQFDPLAYARGSAVLTSALAMGRGAKLSGAERLALITGLSWSTTAIGRGYKVPILPRDEAKRLAAEKLHGVVDPRDPKDALLFLAPNGPTHKGAAGDAVTVAAQNQAVNALSILVGAPKAVPGVFYLSSDLVGNIAVPTVTPLVGLLGLGIVVVGVIGGVGVYKWLDGHYEPSNIKAIAEAETMQAIELDRQAIFAKTGKMPPSNAVSIELSKHEASSSVGRYIAAGLGLGVVGVGAVLAGKYLGKRAA